MAEPIVLIDHPKIFGIKNAPYAAIAELKPTTAEDSFGLSKEEGIILKMDPFAIPVAKNRIINIMKYPIKLLILMK